MKIKIPYIHFGKDGYWCKAWYWIAISRDGIRTAKEYILNPPKKRQ